MSSAAEIRKKVLPSRNRFWRPEDFSGSPGSVAKALSRLAAAGELRHIRRGLYWRGVSTPFGMAPPPASRLAEEIGGSLGLGPAEESAAVALGLSTQVPKRVIVAVPGRAPSDTHGVRFVSRAGSTRRRDERLNPSEVALLEVLRDWDRLVDLPMADAAKRVEKLASDRAIRIDKVVLAADTEPARARTVLRRLLDALHLGGHIDKVRPARSHLDPELAAA